MKRPFKSEPVLPQLEVGSFERVSRGLELLTGHQFVVEYDIRREPHDGSTIDFYRCFDKQALPDDETHQIDTIYDIPGRRVASVEKRDVVSEYHLGVEEIWVVRNTGSSQESRFVDGETLHTIADMVDSKSTATNVEQRQFLPTKLEEESQVREFLEGREIDFDIEIYGNLDTEGPWDGKRGDYRVRYCGEEAILEVEKDVEDFFKHEHRTSGESGWADPGSIDIVFAATDNAGRANEIDAPVIVAENRFFSWLNE